MTHFLDDPISLINATGLFLWEFVKEIIYKRRITNVDDIKGKITVAIDSVDADMLTCNLSRN